MGWELNSVLTHPAQWQFILDQLKPAPIELWRQVKEILDCDFENYVLVNDTPGGRDNRMNAILPEAISQNLRLTNKKCFTRAAELKKTMDNTIEWVGTSDSCTVGIASRTTQLGYHEWLFLFYKYGPPDGVRGIAWEGVWRYDPWKPNIGPEIERRARVI